MNSLKKVFVTFLINTYNKKTKVLKLRKLIKFLLNDERILIKYQDIKILAGLNSAIESSLLFDEYNEKKILNLIKYFAKKQYNLIDVGANIGVHSLIAAQSNSSIEIFSFEPEPNNFHNFITNISLNAAKNIRPFYMGIGNQNETKILNINDGWNKGRHSLKMEFGDNAKKVDIPIASLDKFKEYIDLKPLMIKIDVEGFEKEVIDGAVEIFNKIDDCIIIIELLEENNNASVCQEITQLLQNSEFEFIYKIENENQFSKVENYQGSSDYVFIKGSKTFDYFKQFIA